MKRRAAPKRTLYLALLLALAALALLIGGVMFTLPRLGVAEDLSTLVLVMAVIGVASIVGGYVAYRLRLARWLGSLRWALLATMILTVALIFLNVWVTAHLMFISEYDLMVTALLLVFAGGIALIFGFFVFSAITDSIRELARAAEQIAQGDLGTRLDVHGNDELAEFGTTFNWMAQRLEEVDKQKRELDQQRRDLIAWASHDLRTPVTSIRAMIEAMVDGVVSDPQTTNRYLHNMDLEIQHLTKLIDNLLELSQLDAGHITLNYQMASLRDLISDTLGSMSIRAQQQHIRLTGEVADGADMLYIAPDKVQRILNNLLDNALRYTPEGGSVTLTARPDGDVVRVQVHNSGAGMVGIDLTQVFTRFYREERSRAQAKDGHRGAGLGLAITRGFVEAHGGKIWVDSESDGVTFTFTLPIRQPKRQSIRQVKRQSLQQP